MHENETIAQFPVLDAAVPVLRLCQFCVYRRDELFCFSQATSFAILPSAFAFVMQYYFR